MKCRYPCFLNLPADLTQSVDRLVTFLTRNSSIVKQRMTTTAGISYCTTNYEIGWCNRFPEPVFFTCADNAKGSSMVENLRL